LMATSVASCATSEANVDMVSQATGSAYFTLGAPRLYGDGSDLRAVGRVCRRSRTTQLSPARVRLEHIGAGGQIVEVARARVPAIYRNADQSCADYGARVNWRVAQGETIRACFDRARACPIDATVKTTITAPAEVAAPR
jgi:hypothetical protein